MVTAENLTLGAHLLQLPGLAFTRLFPNWSELDSSKAFAV